MDSQLLATILASAAILVGCVGIVVPVLPGSILIGVAALAWAIVTGGTVGWTTFAVIGVLVLVGMSASWILTGSQLKKKEIPNSILMIGGAAAIVGFFVIPIVGLLVGFLAGIYGAEWYRLKDPKQAWSTTVTALKAAGIGMAVEFVCGMLSAGAFATGVALTYL